MRVDRVESPASHPAASPELNSWNLPRRKLEPLDAASEFPQASHVRQANSSPSNSSPIAARKCKRRSPAHKIRARTETRCEQLSNHVKFRASHEAKAERETPALWNLTPALPASRRNSSTSSTSPYIICLTRIPRAPWRPSFSPRAVRSASLRPAAERSPQRRRSQGRCGPLW